jgi:hypothetical protein
MTPVPLTKRSCFRRFWIQLLACILAGLFLVGCATSPVDEVVAIFGTPHDVQADWDDADASVEVALHQVQMALDHIERDEQGLECRYYLLTTTDEPATLTLRRDKVVFDGPQTITLEAHVGRFGDKTRENQLIRAVRHRLKSLAGKTHAPVTVPPTSESP